MKIPTIDDTSLMLCLRRQQAERQAALRMRDYMDDLNVHFAGHNAESPRRVTRTSTLVSSLESEI